MTVMESVLVAVVWVVVLPDGLVTVVEFPVVEFPVDGFVVVPPVEGLVVVPVGGFGLVVVSVGGFTEGLTSRPL